VTLCRPPGALPLECHVFFEWPQERKIDKKFFERKKISALPLLLPLLLGCQLDFSPIQNAVFLTSLEKQISKLFFELSLVSKARGERKLNFLLWIKELCPVP